MVSGLPFCTLVERFEHRVRADDGIDAAQGDLFVRCLFTRDVWLIARRALFDFEKSAGGTPKIHHSLAADTPSQILCENPRPNITRATSSERG